MAVLFTKILYKNNLCTFITFIPVINNLKLPGCCCKPYLCTRNKNPWAYFCWEFSKIKRLVTWSYPCHQREKVSMYLHDFSLKWWGKKKSEQLQLRIQCAQAMSWVIIQSVAFEHLVLPFRHAPAETEP